MKQIEENIVRSFNGVKYDLSSIQTQIYDLMKKNQELESTIYILRDQMRTVPRELVRTVVKTKVKAKKTKFVGTKESNKYHLEACPFAKNIKKKSKITFSTKKIAEKKGYKPCKCLK